VQLRLKKEYALIKDQFAEGLAGPEGFQVFQRFKSIMTQSSILSLEKQIDIYESIFAVRTKFFDDFMIENANRIAQLGHIPQVVIGGAGLDTRALRLDWPQNTVIYEIDRAEVFKFKESRLQELLKTIKPSPNAAKRVLVDADLSQESWVEDLIKAGFKKDTPSIWLTEGLLVFLYKKDAALLQKKN